MLSYCRSKGIIIRHIKKGEIEEVLLLKIKSKLLLLIISLIASLFFAISIFVVLQLNINKLENEKEYFIKLEKKP